MIFKALILLVVLSPLPFASVYPWSRSLIAVAIGFLLVGWLLQVLRGKVRLSRGSGILWLAALFFGVAISWIIFQTLPYPPDGWKHALWEQASTVLGVPLAASISINTESGLESLMGLLSYAGIFWLSYQYGRNEKNADKGILVLWVAGTFYAAYGVWVLLSGAQTILWFPKFAYIGDVTSTFVNRNSYATYAGLGLVCVTGKIVQLLAEPIVKPLSRVERLRQLIETTSEKGWYLFLAWMTIMSALILAHSRAGFVSTMMALIVVTLILTMAKGLKFKAIAAIGGVFFVVTIFFMALSGDVLDERFGQLLEQTSGRLIVYGLLIEEIIAKPWFGVGFGAFPEAFSSIRAPELTMPFLKGHNTYLENAWELGLPASTALLGVFACFLYATLRGVRNRRFSRLHPAIGFSSTVLVGLHSLVDFSMQIPAVAVTYCFIIGLSCAQSVSSREPERVV